MSKELGDRADIIEVKGNLDKIVVQMKNIELHKKSSRLFSIGEWVLFRADQLKREKSPYEIVKFL